MANENTVQEQRKPTAKKAPSKKKEGAQNEADLHKKHRQRVFREIEEYGLDGLSEHRVLEYVLFFCIPRCDTNPIAHALINEFGSFAAVLEASEEDLCTVKGIGPAAAKFLHALPSIDRYYALNKVKRGTRLETIEKQAAFLIPHFRSQENEVFLMLAMDAKGKLLKKMVVEEGTVGTIQFNASKVAMLAIKAGAAAVILAHNHPGGAAIPSQDDILATGEVMRALGLLDIRTLDHIIVAGEEYYSLVATDHWPFYDTKTKTLRYFKQLED